MSSVGGYGGIGRRARFRFWCFGRGGSSPPIRRLKKILKGNFKIKKIIVYKKRASGGSSLFLITLIDLPHLLGQNLVELRNGTGIYQGMVAQYRYGEKDLLALRKVFTPSDPGIAVCRNRNRLNQ